MTDHKTLACFKEFRCQSCTNCCQTPWIVPLNNDDYARLETLITQKHGKDRVGDFIQKIDFASNTQVVGEVKKREHNRCVFLNDQTNFCDLQVSFGHEVLPLPCKSFPRSRVYNNGEQSYVLSAYCPTVQELLTTPNASHVVKNLDYDPKSYPGYVSTTEKTQVPLKTTSMTLEAYEHIKAYAAQCFENTSFTVDETVYGIGKWLHEIYQSASQECLNKGDADKLATHHKDHGLKDLHTVFSELPTKVDQQLLVAGSWLKLRFSLGIIDEIEIAELAQKYGPQSLEQSNPQKFHQTYVQNVAPLFEKHHWSLRNYLASKLIYDPHAVELGAFSLPYIQMCFAYLLVRLCVVEMAYKGPVDLKHLNQAMAVVDANTLHVSLIEKQLAELFAKNNLSPKVMMDVVKIY